MFVDNYYVLVFLLVKLYVGSAFDEYQYFTRSIYIITRLLYVIFILHERRGFCSATVSIGKGRNGVPNVKFTFSVLYFRVKVFSFSSLYFKILCSILFLFTVVIKRYFYGMTWAYRNEILIYTKLRL